MCNVCQYKSIRGKNKGKIICKKQCENGKKYCKSHAKSINNQLKRELKRELKEEIKKREKMKKKKEREELKKKKDEATAKEREKKRIEREKKKKLRAPKAGTCVKGRDGSTRHGMAMSYSKHHAPEITVHDVDHRNELLGIDPNKCFWCKTANKECGDHAHPCCNTTNHEYSHTNALNIVPSCHSCNSKKGGKRLEDWINMLDWPEDKKIIYKNWLYENKDKLLCNKESTEYLERQFLIIDKIHSILEYCAKYNLEIDQFITVVEPKDL